MSTMTSVGADTGAGFRAQLNIHGEDWTGRNGLAEAARRLTLALQRHGADIAISTIPAGSPELGCTIPEEFRAFRTGRPYPIDLWTTNIHMFHLASNVMYEPGYARRYNIATWYWELSTLPERWAEVIKSVDEIWVPGRFVQRIFSRHTSLPVVVVPPVVPVLAPSAGSAKLRHRFGLPTNAVVFLFSFDYRSDINRKNPLAVVEAFERAIPTSARGTDVYLVIKAINSWHNPAFAVRLKEAVHKVGGLLIDGYLSPNNMADLFNACDVYVSLHRGEGFGLGMAEAMAIGKAVIGTAYSGNLDFMTNTNSCLVGHELTTITQGDPRYEKKDMLCHYGEGSVWAEPDIDQAVLWMRLLAEDEDLRIRIGVQAASDIRQNFSEAEVARVALNRLAILARETGSDLPGVSAI